MSNRLNVPKDMLEMTVGVDRVLDNASVNATLPKSAAHVIKVLAGTGSLVVVFANGNSRTYTGLAVGDEVLGEYKQITASGTTVTSVRVEWLS